MTDSDALIEQYRQIHQTKVYGNSSETLTGLIQRQVEGIILVSRVLDYGCGQSRLVDWIARLNAAHAVRYDPAIPEHSTLHSDGVDLVLCTDVMEHIPEDDVSDTLQEIASISINAYFNIALTPASEILPNGENAHCTVRPARWWARQLRAHFRVVRSVNAARKDRASFVTWSKPGE